MAETSGGLVESIMRLPGEFADVVAQSPEQAILVAVGALLVFFSAGLFGALAFGGVVDAVIEALPSGSQPPRRGR
jgi:ABC-type Mn2+/Zn2+ transport system permease subunit